jgi:membrane protease YdiL (CAAX protease family)
VEKRKFLNIFFTRVEPLLALVFFAAAPVVSPQRVFSPPSIERALFLALCGMWLSLGMRYTQGADQIPMRLSAGEAIRRAVYGAALFALLCVFGTACYALSARFGNTPSAAQIFPADRPVGVFDFTALCTAMTASAFFEETFYRAYLPLRAGLFFRRRFAPCLLSVVLFAAAHKNGGYFTILNALAAGAALQYGYEKTGSLLTTCAAHTLYNVFALVFFMGAGK